MMWTAVLSLVLGLHLAVLGLAEWLAIEPAGDGARLPLAMTVVPVRPVASPPAAATARAVGNEPKRTEPPAAVAELRPPEPKRPGRRYFEADEVDQPAVPEPDWQVDPETLIAANIRSLRAEVQVSNRGIAERCRVLEMNPPSAQAQARVERELCSTRLRPAMRAGVAVPSVRRIEMLLSQ